MNHSPEFYVSAGILELESKIGVPENFFRALCNEDDWSFIIKLHALFEAACTHLLLFHFKEPDLSTILSRLELSNKTTGKIAFLGALELLNKDNRRFISTLSELRNSLVHDVRNAQFSLSVMVMSLDAPTTRNLALSFSPFETLIRNFPFDPKMNLGFEEKYQEQAKLESVVLRFSNEPKFHIWLGAFHVLNSMVDMYGYSDFKQWTKVHEYFPDDAP